MGKIANIIKRIVRCFPGEITYHMDRLTAETEIIKLINPGCFPAGFETTMESDKYDREYAKGWNDCRIAFAENLAKLRG